MNESAEHYSTEPMQRLWESELALSGLDHVGERLSQADYLEKEFPSLTSLVIANELIVWQSEHILTTGQVREAMIERGLIPACPQLGPTFAPKQERDTVIFIPQLSESAGSFGYRRIASLFRGLEYQSFDLIRNHPRLRWKRGAQFLCVRPEPFDISLECEPVDSHSYV